MKDFIRFYNIARWGLPIIGFVFILNSSLGFFGIGNVTSNGNIVYGTERTLSLIAFLIGGIAILIVRFTIMKNKL
jgi:hypothetical protein